LSIPYLIWHPTALRTFPWYPLLHTGSRLALAAGLAGAMFLMIWGYFHKASTAYRRGARLIMLSSGIAFVPFATFGLLPEVGLGYPLVPYWALFPLLVAIPAGYGYAILRHRLLRLDRFVNRTIAHMIAAVLTVSWVVVLSSWVRSRWLLDARGNTLVDLVVVLVVAWLFSPTLVQVQRLVDWVFYGGWYHHQDVVERVVDALDRAAGPSTFTHTVCEQLCDAMKLKCACLVLTDRTHLHGLAAQSQEHDACDIMDPVHTPSQQLSATGVLSHYFEHSKSIVEADVLRQDVGPLSNGLERQLVSCERICLWVPLREGDTLLGLLGIGPKLGADYFGEADRQTLGIIANHVATTIRNLDLAAQLASRMSEVNALHQRLLFLREEERKQLARDLHDQVIQGLVSLQFQIAHTDGESRLPLYESIGELVRELRALCRGLRPPVLDSLGLVPAIRSHVRELARSNSIQIRLDIVGDKERQISEDVALTVFRALQEALTNVVKHAEAGSVDIKLAIQPDEIALSVRDDGRGFDVPSSLGTFLACDSFGLIGLRERLDLVSGTLNVLSTPKQGTELQIRVPLIETTGQEYEGRLLDDKVVDESECTEQDVTPDKSHHR
jgi:signal transduction histidine kinase